MLVEIISVWSLSIDRVRHGFWASLYPGSHLDIHMCSVSVLYAWYQWNLILSKRLVWRFTYTVCILHHFKIRSTTTEFMYHIYQIDTVNGTWYRMIDKMLLTTDILWEYWIELVAMELRCIVFTFPKVYYPGYFRLCDCPCDVWVMN